MIIKIIKYNSFNLTSKKSKDLPFIYSQGKFKINAAKRNQSEFFSGANQKKYGNQKYKLNKSKFIEST